MTNDTVGANTPASPKSALIEDYDELLAAKAVADTRLAMADAKRKKDADKAAKAVAQAENDKKWEARQAFTSAYHSWLAARTGIEDPSTEEEDQPERFRAQTEAERRLFMTAAANGEQVWDKLTAFEQILGEELAIGLRRESVLMLAVGSIKQDIINLELHI